jgi:predicted alpha/beta superfamily hydrolase
LYARPRLAKSLWFSSSEEKVTEEPAQHLADILRADAATGARWHYEKMPQEKHATIYHPAALKAFRMMLAPVAQDGAH